MRSSVQWIENGKWHTKEFGALLDSIRDFINNLMNIGIKEIYLGIDYNKA